MDVSGELHADRLGCLGPTAGLDMAAKRRVPALPEIELLSLLSAVVRFYCRPQVPASRNTFSSFGDETCQRKDSHDFVLFVHLYTLCKV